MKHRTRMLWMLIVCYGPSNDYADPFCGLAFVEGSTMANSKSRNTRGLESGTEAVLRHWQKAVPDDRMAHLIKDTWRGLTRSFQMRLNEHAVSYGHWIFLRILWEKEGVTPSELSQQAGLMRPTTFS